MSWKWWIGLGSFGFASGFLQGLIMTPFESQKTRIQVQAFQNIVLKSSDSFLSKTSFLGNGFALRGYIPCVAYHSLVCTAYCLLSDVFRRELFYEQEV